MFCYIITLNQTLLWLRWVYLENNEMSSSLKRTKGTNFWSRAGFGCPLQQRFSADTNCLFIVTAPFCTKKTTFSTSKLIEIARIMEMNEFNEIHKITAL